MIFSDHTDKKEKILLKVIQNDVKAPLVSDSGKMQYPLYGDRLLHTVIASAVIGTHCGCLAKSKLAFNIFLSIITRFYQKISAGLFFSTRETIYKDMVSKAQKA